MHRDKRERERVELERNKWKLHKSDRGIKKTPDCNKRTVFTYSPHTTTPIQIWKSKNYIQHEEHEQTEEKLIVLSIDVYFMLFCFYTAKSVSIEFACVFDANDNRNAFWLFCLQLDAANIHPVSMAKSEILIEF